MKGKRILTGVSFIIALMALTISLTLAQGPGPQGPGLQGEVSTQAALGTAFTYQGRLVRDNTPVNDTCDFQFTLWDAQSGGSQVGSPLEKSGVSVTDGYFTVQLDFGSGAFTGNARWLQIEVKCTGETDYTDLGRQPITPAPYALFSSSAPWSGLTGVPSGLNDGDDDTLGGLSCASGQVPKWNGSAWVCGDDDDTSYTAGTGLSLSGTQFSLASTYRLPQTCSNGQIAEWNGSAWVCGDDDDTTYTAGTAITIAAGNVISVTDAGIGTAQLADGAVTSDKIQDGTIALADIGQNGCGSGQVMKWNGSAWACSADDNSGGDITAVNVGTGLSGGGDSGDVTLSLDTGYTDNRYWKLDGNTLGSPPGSQFLGTTDEVTLTLKVSGTTALRLAPTTGTPNVIGGYSGNSVAAGVVGATIGGGGGSAGTNRVTAKYGSVGGGYNNEAGNNYATVGGGVNNTASGPYATVGGGVNNTASYYYATVCGGIGNIASWEYATVGGGDSNTADGSHATVGGGQANTASGTYATVGGGWANKASDGFATVGGGQYNTASGIYATVPGGYSNIASGNYSFAAGRRAKANVDGCFVWGDSTNADITCTVQDAFIVRASGGVTMYTSSDLSTGATLQPGSGSWSSLSDREAKENFGPVDSQAVLEKVAGLSITTWNYKAQDDSIRHMGPMAQDFYAAFGVGEDDKHISTVDADGVALAAIQGLHQQNQEQAARIAQLEAENAKLRAQVDDLAARVAALEEGRSASPLFGTLLPGAGLLLLAGMFTRRQCGRDQR